MNSTPAGDRPQRTVAGQGGVTGLIALAVLSCTLYLGVALLSDRFRYEASTAGRPIPAVLLLLAAAFAVYAEAIRRVVRSAPGGRQLTVILAGSLAFRGLLWLSTPIQEVDIYRYLWDGAVLAEGVTPFRYSPQQVLAAPATTAHPASPVLAPSDLSRLAALRDSDPGLRTVLHRIHYPELPTVYPPVSQAVFAAAASCTPAGASVAWRAAVMKAWLLLFDVGTLLLILWLLRRTGRPATWCLIYGWCPLVIKEFANSGHLDSIAVFWTTLSLCLIVAALNRVRSRAGAGSLRNIGLSLMSAAAMALGVGAKLYPLVLMPLLVVLLVRSLGWLRSAAPILVLAGSTLVVLWPLFPGPSLADATAREASGESCIDTASRPDPSRGLKTYLQRWEMNDFLFLIAIENLKAPAAVPANQAAWFSLAPSKLRQWSSSVWTTQWREDGNAAWQASFHSARAVTAAVFLLIADWLIWRAARRPDMDRVLEAAFLTLAWFWLLNPAQNPWYWIWAVPLLPWARSRAWLALSGLVLLYYLRFWFAYQFPDEPVWGTPYVGATFFDMVVTWLEYAPWFLWLALTTCGPRRS